MKLFLLLSFSQEAKETPVNRTDTESLKTLGTTPSTPTPTQKTPKKTPIPVPRKKKVCVCVFCVSLPWNTMLRYLYEEYVLPA